MEIAGIIFGVLGVVSGMFWAWFGLISKRERNRR